ncbi:MAG: tRNA pseudouridine(55) synthase TruB, partial [Patescibacteria group bacterium]
HAGTLDPFATGLLIVGVGREATKRLDEFKNLPKTYEAVLFLGATSETGDPTGEITNPKYQISKPDEATIKTVLKKFIGKQEQTPPMFSAKKINGQRLYTLARQGQTVERKPAQIEIYEIKFLSYAWPYLKIEVSCSAGTYIRTLAQDIGQALGVGAYCLELTRTAIGPYILKEAETL